MKKLLLTTLALFSFVGLTACGNSAKKLSEEEAKEELRLAAENTKAAAEKLAKVEAKAGLNFSANIKNVTLGSASSSLFAITVETGKASAKADAKGSLAFDKANGIFKAEASANANAKYNLSFKDSDEALKDEIEAKGTAEVYAKKINDTKANLFLSYNATLPEDKMEEYGIDASSLTGIKKYATTKFNSIFDGIKFDDDDTETEFEFDFIKDWTIFSKKGSKIIADCSDLKAFDLGDDFAETQVELEKIGLNLKVSKFEVTLTKDHEIAGADLEVSLKGTADLSKVEFETEDIIELISQYAPQYSAMASMITDFTLKGKVTVDATVTASVKASYDAQTLTIPTKYNNVVEEDLDEIIDQIFSQMFNTRPEVVDPSKIQMQ